jgi:hypothetical protein
MNHEDMEGVEMRCSPGLARRLVYISPVPAWKSQLRLRQSVFASSRTFFTSTSSTTPCALSQAVRI